MKEHLIYFYYDTMRVVWGFYHKWILHRGKLGFSEFFTCRHRNPFNVLTPKLFKKQIENSKNVEL